MKSPPAKSVCGSRKKQDLVASTMSPNLRSALGLLKAPEEPATTAGGAEANGDDWRPPTFSGLTNSKPLTTLKPLVVGHNDKGLQLEYKKETPGDDVERGGDEGDEWSEEEGWDYEGIGKLVPLNTSSIYGGGMQLKRRCVWHGPAICLLRYQTTPDSCGPYNTARVSCVCPSCFGRATAVMDKKIQHRSRKEP